MPKLAVIVASLTSVAWVFFLYRNETGMTLAVLAIPVILSFVGGLGNERQRDAGIAIVLLSLLAFLLSGWIWLSFLPSAILLLISKKGRGFMPRPYHPSRDR